MSELVSIVIPAYNHEAYVAVALESALGQGWSDVEVIVVDDGSRDRTWEIVSDWKGDARVRLFRQENRGAHAAINRGLGEARGEYLSVLNSDDEYAPDRLERLVERARGMDGPIVLFTDVALVQDDGAELPKGHERRSYYEDLVDRTRGLALADAFLVGNPAMSTSNFFMNRQAYELVGPFRALRYTHDWDWALRACGQVEMAWLEGASLRYRVHGANTLGEADGWRHITENAFIFASHLGASHLGASHLKRGGLGRGPDTAAIMGAYCSLLLGNQSFLPTAVLLFMLLLHEGVTEESLEAALAQDLPERFAELYSQCGLSGDCLLSASHLDARLGRSTLGDVLGRLRRACGL